MTLYGEHNDGLSRRQLLRRTSIVGASLAWTIPAVQSIPSSALAAVGSLPGNGAPSYVFVFYTVHRGAQRSLHVVKYGDAAVDPATEQQISNDEPAGHAFYAATLRTLVAQGFVRSMDGFPWATVVSTTSSLQVRIDDPACSIAGWFVHDGSCKDTGSKFVSSATPVVGGVAVGPAVPTTVGGVFAWQKCKP